MNATAQDGTGITARPPRVLLRGSGCSPAGPAVVVYRLESGRHRQTGVVVEVSIDDYRGGRIRRHEATQPARVRELEEQAETTGTERMPVMLVHRGHLRIAEITAEAPTARLNDKGVTHTVWIRHDEAWARALCDEIGRIGNLYIADGHHRMLAAERYAARRGHLGSEHPSAFTLAALFPSDEMRILGYHRCFTLASGNTARDVLDRLAEHPLTERIEESPAAETKPGVVAVGVGDRWYRLRLRASGALDAFAIEQELLPKLHDLTEAEAAPGSHAVETCRCSGQNAFRLIPHPPTIDQVLAISDEGRPMPPKSTWFDPKPTANLFLRPLT
ncbi:DUF1015 family protein [Saccharopolyspora sp. NPDC050389]|uniref:DUF1015 family protein n=1 Tax=Saccharopolyspora sp. NPDC050389 TaxID=3155516 RepID=UPI0033FC765C